MKQLLVAIMCVGLLVVVEAAKVKVDAEGDPAFNFETVKTWAWDAEPGDVIMARTPEDDPAALKKRLEPLVLKAVTDEMTKRGLVQAGAGQAPDIHLHYYVLVTVNTSGQYMGQFLPAVPYWGLPPFAPVATSLKIVTKGALVLDAMLPGTVGERKVVWRGIAQSTVKDDDKPAVREARIRDAAEGLVSRFPQGKKK